MQKVENNQRSIKKLRTIIKIIIKQGDTFYFLLG
jgi:hypothetical protein